MTFLPPEKNPGMSHNEYMCVYTFSGKAKKGKEPQDKILNFMQASNLAVFGQSA